MMVKSCVHVSSLISRKGWFVRHVLLVITSDGVYPWD